MSFWAVLRAMPSGKAEWPRKKGKGVKCRCWGMGQWLVWAVLAREKSEQRKEDKNEASILENYWKSSTNKKILWLLSLKMPKPLSISLASKKDGIYADVVFVPEWPSCHLHFKIITNSNWVNGDVFKRLAFGPRLTLKQKWQFHW